MRWKTPNVGDTKTIRKFLWFPLTIHGETRWLEFASVAYTYTCERYLDSDFVWKYYWLWTPANFVDSEG